MTLQVGKLTVEVIRNGGRLDINAWKDEGYTHIYQALIHYSDLLAQLEILSGDTYQKM